MSSHTYDIRDIPVLNDAVDLTTLPPLAQIDTALFQPLTVVGPPDTTALQEAIIGVTFVLASSAAILLLAGNPHGGEHLKDLLVGQILWVDRTQLLWLGGLSAVLLAALRFGWVGRFGSFGFYTAFALAVTASVQLVGVYLVFSSLIIPALATRGQRGRRRYTVAYGLGVAGYALGLALSALFDLPSGAVVVWTLALCAVAGALALAPSAAGAGAATRDAS